MEHREDDPSEDEERVKAVRDAVGDSVQVRDDAVKEFRASGSVSGSVSK